MVLIPKTVALKGFLKYQQKSQIYKYKKVEVLIDRNCN